MTTELEYQRAKSEPPAAALVAPFGRASLNRVYISVGLFLVWLFVTPLHAGRFGFAYQLIQPYVLAALAIWGIYYGIRGAAKDFIKFYAIAGIVMNLVCLTYHGIVLFQATMEFWTAYTATRAKIMIDMMPAR